MGNIIILILFFWLFIKVLGLAFKVAWGTAKIAASILLTLALPLLVACLALAGGVLLLLPLAMIAAAFGLLKKCV